MEEHPTPWDLKLEGTEYVIRNANGGEVSRHKKKAEAMAAFKAGTDQGETTGPAAIPPDEVVEIPPADAVAADPPVPEITPQDDPPINTSATPSKSRKRGRRK